MKKILLLIMLLIPISVNAEVNVINHLITAEIEIAGALKVKELIVLEKETNELARTVNYKMLEEVWDKKTIDFNVSPIYNGYSIDTLKVSAFNTNDEVTFETFDNKKIDYFNELDLDKKQKNCYTTVKNKLGSNINIYYDSKKEGHTVYYLEYVVTNVVVNHEDIMELNYTFKNLNYEAESTFIRLIIPYPTDDDKYKFWVHGPSNGEVSELVNPNSERIGFLAHFPKIKTEVNLRVTLPLEHVGINIYLNKSKVEALPDILKIEQAKIDKRDFAPKLQNILKNIIIVISVIYVLCSVLIYKYYNKHMLIMYLILGLLIMLFNFLFKYNIIYIYLIIIFPILIFLQGFIKEKKITKSKRRKKKK